jgi:hypothetical protein
MAVEATADPLGGRHCYNPKVRCVGTYLVTTFTLMCCLLMGILKPFHNWDMIGYTAAAYHADGFRGKDLSDRTYSAIKDEVTPEKFAYLTQSDHYKKTVFENPSSLEQQIPFYSIRVIYVRLVQSLGRMGMAYPRATYVLAAVFSAASVVVLSVLFAKLGVTIAALPVVVFISSFVAIARNSTPDSLACFLSLLALHGALSAGRPTVYLIAALLPAARTDFVILSVLLMCFTFSRNRSASIGVLVSAVLVYVMINHFTGNYGWLVITNFSLVFHPYPASMPISTDLLAYLRPYAWAAARIVEHPHGVVYALAAVLIFKVRRPGGLVARDYVLALVPLGFVLIHLVSFPWYQERYFAFSAASVFTWVLALMSRVNSSRMVNAGTAGMGAMKGASAALD